MKRVALLSLLLVGSLQAESGFYNDYHLEPHNYFKAEKRDPMSVLLKKVESGEIPPLNEPYGKKLVARLLKEMDIPVESQTLVFSKTSLQKAAVNPANPRAIYFNEEVYLGWMPNGRIEIGSIDPWLGSIFYFQRPLDKRDGPLFTIEKRCLGCHAGSATNFLPGPLGRSIYPKKDGRVYRNTLHELTGHEIAIEKRWGGWYVSGEYGDLRHLGNGIAYRNLDGQIVMDRDKNANINSLSKFYPKENFLYGDKSDVLAMLLLDHQIGMHYRLMEVHYKARQILFDNKVKDADLTKMPEKVQKELREAADMAVKYLLFKDEAPLGPNLVHGDSGLREVFLKDRKKAANGKSLKDLRLSGSMFKHRCSYMIYSKAFTEMPVAMKQSVYALIDDILKAETPVSGYEYLPKNEREQIRTIASETISGWPKS